MPESLETTLARARGLVARLDAEAARLKKSGNLESGKRKRECRRMIEIALARSDAEKAIAALTVGRMKTI